MQSSLLAGAMLVRAGLSCSKARLRGRRPLRTPRDAMLRKLYDWVLNLSAKPSAPYALGAVSFADSSFFPVPPDVMLIPMALARPERAYLYAAVCTVTSVLGALLGYAIGALLFESIGQYLFHLYGLEKGADAFRAGYAKYGALIIVIKGLTPIPYKIVTIASGFAGYDLVWFVILSILTRGARFFALAALIGRFGPQIRHILDRHLGLAVAVAGAVVVSGFVALKYIG